MTVSIEEWAEAGERAKKAEHERDALADALRKIKDWSDAYPREAFPEPTTAEWQRAAQALSDAGLSLDRLSASNMRHVVEGVGRIAKEALAALEEEQ